VAAQHGWFSTYIQSLVYPVSISASSTKLEVRGELVSRDATPSPAFKKLKVRVRYAHGILMGIAFLGFYPLAAILMRLARFRYVVWIHAGLQIFAMLVMYAGLGTGIWFAKADGSLYDADTLYLKAHTYIGTIVPALMIMQPFFGYLAHRGFLKTGTRSLFAFVHTYFGRILILAGAINGIVGRENEGPDYTHGRTIWSAIFGVVLGIYVIVIGVTAYLRRKKGVSKVSSSSSRASNEKEHEDIHV